LFCLLFCAWLQRIALQSVISAMPAPRREGAEDPIQSPTGNAKRRQF
jgi:hypothetical protein